ncbi:dephospho-CoA kinase [Variovorax arabinosiphilus]|uniref:dephospho-CoA kinase n=1 Tax=Variovorax arabinosiphilus TaxID=3053498 RepID=UPI0025761481|nr:MULTISPECIES: dephospho-CoA kinase [unclassified Variovorax]MDM0120525.1 dephospho-CoA kinase [Variovorax sp. J2L1-78]MDM0127563.1 dephospho-CoA kinase [Variovorax sp. J2L1-63]MDM0231262.1 dephospho-CoA kinase [Variovorax sp. J2R1-6]
MRIGLTGGIGSGKSTVAAMLSDLGATLIDTDAISRAITLPRGPAIPAIQAAFGANVLDAAGGLDRARMRDIVFAQADAKRRLEAILHPLIGIETERQATAAAGTTLVFDVPLLVESKRWRRIVDRVLVVDASEATQLTRVMARSGWAPDAVRAVIAQQAPRRERRAAADAVVFNDGLSLEALAGEVRSLWTHWIGHSAP